MSVARMVDAGNVVHFDDENPHIINKKTGEITNLRREGNVFVVDLWHMVPPAGSGGTGSPKQGRNKDTATKGKAGPAPMVLDAGFTRPGR